MMVLPVFQLAFKYLRKLSPPPPSPCPHRELIYTENKHYVVFAKCVTHSFFDFRAVPSVNVFILVAVLLLFTP
jgi:hypothetical protein